MKQYHFVDRVTVEVVAGLGGNGCCSFRREKFVPRGGPDGGDGGRGGHVILKGDHDTDSLVRLFYMPVLKGEDGRPGSGQRRHGRNGGDCVVKVPCGTQVFRVDGDVLTLVGDVVAHGQMLSVASGGNGGLGNTHWKSSTHQAPRECTPGEDGQRFVVRLELKIIANAGLAGFPNAGKSSLLRRISDAHPRVAAYPFTTLHPVIGTVSVPPYRQIRVADIPGIIEGAHRGVGLGHDFLRHIERSALLVYVLDMAGVDGREPWDDYEKLRLELRAHAAALPERPSLVVANKMDLPEARQNLPRFIERTGREVIPVSTVSGEGVPRFVERLVTALDALVPTGEVHV